jgi:2-polyprenyl-6-methoxyphenol hydroxylase-like FAD-dependent oxidoreductase
VVLSSHASLAVTNIEAVAILDHSETVGVWKLVGRSNMTRRVAIVGGGIGGLTVGTFLAKRGWEVRIYERSPELRVHGSGIALSAQSQRVLHTLGALERIIAGRPALVKREARDAKGGVIATLNWPDPLYFVDRRTLMLGLSRAASDAGASIVTNAEVKRATVTGEIEFVDGTIASADLIVGADGAYSKVRGSLPFNGRRTTLPYGSARALATSASELKQIPTDTWVQYWAKGRKIFYAPLSDNRVYLSFAAARVDVGPEPLERLDSDVWARGLAPVDISSWMASFPCLTELLSNMPEQPRWAPFEEIRLPRWTMGKVVLIGDAAHAMAPELGYGGTSAMMDAISLAATLDEGKGIEEALQKWEARHRRAVDVLQRDSRLWSKVSYWPIPIQKLIMRVTPYSNILSHSRSGTPDYIPAGVAPASLLR